MGRRGPKPVPTEILKSRGSWLANARRNEPRPPEGEIVPPAWLTDAGRAVWEQMAPICLHMHVLTVADVRRFARYCNLQGAYESDPQSYHDDINRFATLTASLAKYEAQFGLGPSDRANLKVGKPEGMPEADKSRFFRIAGSAL